MARNYLLPTVRSRYLETQERRGLGQFKLRVGDDPLYPPFRGLVLCEIASSGNGLHPQLSGGATTESWTLRLELQNHGATLVTKWKKKNHVLKLYEYLLLIKINSFSNCFDQKTCLTLSLWAPASPGYKPPTRRNRPACPSLSSRRETAWAGKCGRSPRPLTAAWRTWAPRGSTTASRSASGPT